jgi:hypothetical protein
MNWSTVEYILTILIYAIISKWLDISFDTLIILMCFLYIIQLKNKET